MHTTQKSNTPTFDHSGSKAFLKVAKSQLANLKSHLKKVIFNIFSSSKKLTELLETRGCLPKFATGGNVRFTTICSHFFANYMIIFHKTEILLVILRCWTGLKLNWLKSSKANEQKNAKNAKKKSYVQMTIFFSKKNKKKWSKIFLVKS